VRDAAYGRLLRPRRRALHLAVADALIARIEAGRDIAPERIAQHLVEGGAASRWLPYWCRAGEAATRRSANREAVSHLRNGPRALDALPAEASRARAEMELQLALGTPLIAVSGYTGTETFAAYSRALAIAEELGDEPGIFQALYGVWVNAMIRGEHRRAQSMAERLVALALEAGDVAQEITARRVLGFSLSLLGQLEDGQREIEAALSLYRRDQHGRLVLRYGQDPRIAALSILVCSAAIRGERQESDRRARRALSEAEELGHFYTLAYATYLAGAVPSFLFREFEDTSRHVDMLLAISNEQNYPFWRAFGQAMRAALIARTGDGGQAERVLSEALGSLASLSVSWFRPFIHGSVAYGLFASGVSQAAEHHLELARASLERSDERWMEPELDRLSSALTGGNHGPKVDLRHKTSARPSGTP
jgi:predicted ATPase